MGSFELNVFLLLVGGWVDWLLNLMVYCWVWDRVLVLVLLISVVIFRVRSIVSG